MSEITLEVGRKYIDGLGQTIRITQKRMGMIYPYLSDKGSSYTEKGLFSERNPSRLNLVREATDNQLSAD